MSRQRVRPRDEDVEEADRSVFDMLQKVRETLRTKPHKVADGGVLLPYLRKLLKSGEGHEAIRRHSSEYYVLPNGRQLHKATKIGWIPKSPASRQDRDQELDVGSLVLAIRGIFGGEPYNEDEVLDRGYVYVSVPDRELLYSYLSGRADRLPGLAYRFAPEEEDFGDDDSEADDSREGKRPRRRGLEDGPEAPQQDSSTPSIVGLTLEDVMVHTNPLTQLDALASCPGYPVPNVDFVTSVAMDELANWDKRTKHLQDKAKAREREAASKNVANAGSKTSTPQPGRAVPFLMELKSSLRHEGPPIIVVPASKTSLLNILNAAYFLQYGKWIMPNSDALGAGAWLKRPTSVMINKRVNNEEMTFEIFDNTTNFSKSAWLRTVAAFADGKDWQFKGWPFYRHVDLFTTIRGFHLIRETDPTPKCLENWNVTLLRIGLLNRHLDDGACSDFWRQLELFMGMARVKHFTNNAVL